jgi:DNA-binding NarL/FixJ family response regulator
MSMKRSKSKPRLLLADDHAIVMEGLSRLLEADFQIIGTVGDGRALLEAAQRLKPDVIVADLSMPLLNGLEALRQLRRANLRSKVVILSMHADVEFASEALRQGASAYVVKHSASQSLSRAIQQVLEGGTFVSPRIALEMWPAVSAPSQSAQPAATHLTQREREVLQLVAEGRTINGIATILKIAARTVVFHKSNLMDKLGLRTTADLTRHAIRSGLVPALPLR